MVLSFPVPWSKRERETLENAGHMSPRIWEMTKHNIEGGAVKSGVMERICQEGTVALTTMPTLHCYH